MSFLPIALFLLGVIFLIIGWRWQNSSNEELNTALKGLAFLKGEILNVQDQVQVLEDKQRTEQLRPKEELREVFREDYKAKLREAFEAEFREELKDELRVALKETGDKEKNNIYVLNDKAERESRVEVEPQRTISPKYQKVLELAAQGQSISEIAQHLVLSKDAVRMVLQTQSKGVTK